MTTAVCITATNGLPGSEVIKSSIKPPSERWRQLCQPYDLYRTQEHAGSDLAG